MGDVPRSSLGAVNPSPAASTSAFYSLDCFSQSTLHSMSASRNDNLFSNFCSEGNVAQCITYVNQELSSLGFPPLGSLSDKGVELLPVATLNVLYELLRQRQQGVRATENLEVEQRKLCSDLRHAQQCNCRLKDQLETSKRENSALNERERQLQMKVKSLQKCLKSDKEEIQKLQNIISSRATQYNHDMKRRERESGKLKERLNQLLVDKRDKKPAIDILNFVARSNGKRNVWRTEKTDARNEGEMYQTLLSEYERRQKELMLENAELKKVLQQMKREMVTILSPRKPSPKEDIEDSLEQTGSEEEEVEVCEGSREALELSCEHARQQLTNSIRQQWRRLKSHVEKLDNQASQAQKALSPGLDVVPLQAHEEEIERLKQEIQQCKDFIQTQQQLWQLQLTSPCDEETAAMLNDCYMLEEKERLKEEWQLFDEQRKNFETERKSFTEAAIRLGHEVSGIKVARLNPNSLQSRPVPESPPCSNLVRHFQRKEFEEDRATWLKNQFLNMTPFLERRRPSTAKSLNDSTENADKAPCASSTQMVFSTPKTVPAMTPTTADLYRTLRLIPEPSLCRSQPKRGILQDSSQRL